MVEIPRGKIKFLGKKAQEQISAHLESSSSKSKSKFGNKKVTSRDGQKFDSKKEYRRWLALKLAQSAGEIRFLRTQVRFDFEGYEYPSGRTPYYVADFTYERKEPDGSWVNIIEDVKGHRTASYMLKYAIMKKMGYPILET